MTNQLKANLEAVRHHIIYEAHGRQLAVQTISSPDAVEHFDVWMPIDDTNKMDNLLDAIKLYAECPTEDVGWLRVVRRLRQKTAAIKDVLLGKPIVDATGFMKARVPNGIDCFTRPDDSRSHLVVNDIVKRWSEVLQLALREEYKEPGA